MSYKAAVNTEFVNNDPLFLGDIQGFSRGHTRLGSRHFRQPTSTYIFCVPVFLFKDTLLNLYYQFIDLNSCLDEFI